VEVRHVPGASLLVMDVTALVRDSLPVNPPYEGVVAEAYDEWLPPSTAYPDHQPLHDLIVAGSGPALELGCGNGRLLVGFAAAGLEVEGLDGSADMLGRCRAHLAGAGRTAALHLADWVEPDLDRTYATVYNPVSSFSLLHELDAARRALAAWRRLVRPGGRLVLALTGVVPRDGHWTWRVRRSATRPSDGTTFIVHQATSNDPDGARTHSLDRHEVWAADGTLVTTQLRRHCLRWWPPDEIAAALRAAGFADIEIDGPPEGYLALATAG
jgi:SAM-dependent methyltransferase